jgi:hypothetical protein
LFIYPCLIFHRQVVAEDYDLGNTQCLYSKDVASGIPADLTRDGAYRYSSGDVGLLFVLFKIKSMFAFFSNDFVIKALFSI